MKTIIKFFSSIAIVLLFVSCEQTRYEKFYEHHFYDSPTLNENYDLLKNAVEKRQDEERKISSEISEEAESIAKHRYSKYSSEYLEYYLEIHDSLMFNESSHYYYSLFPYTNTVDSKNLPTNISVVDLFEDYNNYMIIDYLQDILRLYIKNINITPVDALDLLTSDLLCGYDKNFFIDLYVIMPIDNILSIEKLPKHYREYLEKEVDDLKYNLDPIKYLNDKNRKILQDLEKRL